MIKSVGLIQPSVNDRGYGNKHRNGDDDLTKSATKKEKKITESSKVPYRISNSHSKRNSDSPSNANLDQYRSSVSSHHHKPSKGYSSKNHLSKSCTALHNYEDGIEITSSEDNTIRIQIKYDESIPTSAYSFTKLPTNICNDNAGISRVSTDFSDNFRFNEKPIDVPEDFERNARLRVREQSKVHGRKKVATSVRQLNPLEEFLQEDWIKIDDDFDEELLQSSLFDRKHIIRHQLRDRPSRRHSSSELNMGVNCSKKLHRIGKHEVVPLQDVAKQINVEPNTTNQRKSTNPFDDDYDNDVDTQTNVRQGISSNRVSEPIQTCWSSKNTSPDVFSPQFSSPRPLSSSIDTNSIMFRSTEIYSARKRQIVRDHLNQSAIPKASRISELNHKRVVHATENGNKNFQQFYHRMGGSFQNLVRVTKNVKGKSASESNLSKLSTNNAKNKSTKRLNSENVDYCPSVFFNRFVAIRERKNAEAEKNFTLKKIKTYLNGNLFNRKRNDQSSRRTIQDLDGRFFEKFGSLLRQKSEYAEEKIVATPLAPLPTDECSAPDNDCQLRTIEEGENDSGTETLQDTDSEHDEQDQTKKNEEIFTDLVGLNIEELYEEVLYEIIHNVGCEVENETCPSALFQYLQDAFKIVNERHDEIMRSAESKEAPEIRLNVEVIEAKELQSKDPNGSSDPFVTLYIASSPTHRYNTSVKSSTLNPSWEEHFSLPITETPNDENLVVEVWDFDPAETVSEKMTKFFDVKGVKGFKKLMKEIAVTASTGKHDNELIGRCNIPLRTIPASGLVMWFSLDKKNKVKRQGLIKIRLAFSAEKNNRVAVQEHKNLLRILLMHELDSSKVAPYWWSGKFSNQGEAVIAQHSAQSGLSAIDCAFAQWSVYTAIHNDHPLAFNLFESLIDKLIRPIQSASISEDEIKNFWDGTTKLLPSCFSVIRKLRKKTATDKNCVKTLTDVLSILSKVAMLEPPEGTDLFPKSIYGWVTRPNDGPSWDIHGTLQDAVTSGAKDWFAHISDNNSTGSNDSDEDKLQNVIKIIQLVRSDLQRAIEYYDKLFQQKMHFPYARTCYVYYEEKLSEYIEPIIHDVCKNLKRLSLPDDRYQPLPEHEEVNMGTTLFELYLVLKRFAVLGTALSPISTDFKINQYHQWFTPGVTHWLDISVYKALIRIEKAIELDQLIPVDETVKYSSSAVDTLAIFYQIKIFWQQLDWPDAEGSYMFVGKIVDDICRCCVFYADRMSTRVEGLGDVQNVYECNKFEVTREWCLAINNIDYIRQSLSPFVKELRVDEIIAKLADYRSPMEAERCSDTLKNVIANALDTETNKIVELIEVVARKMSPPMRRFLTEGAELLHQDSNSMDRIMMYLEDSLQTLNAELNEVNFERILDAIWTELAFILKELVQNNIDRRRPPLFFANLRDTLQLMVKSFKGTQCNKDKVSSDKETLEEIFNLLELHGYETSDLIHQYYIERAKQQDNIPESQYGQLTVRCWFEDNNLMIDVMNARNLVPMDSNGSCDPFVRIHLIPEEKFGNVTTKIKTKAQDKTLFPLFDEKFSIPLTSDQKAMHNAVVMFSVKDKDLFGYANQYIAECYLIFQNIPDDSSDQIHLKLSRPTCTSSECIHALEYRQGDKQAKDFIKKLKQKMNAIK